MVAFFIYICLNKYKIMRFIDIETGDGYVTLTSDDGTKYMLPSSSIIVVDDYSGLKTIKLIATRKILGTLVN